MAVVYKYISDLIIVDCKTDQSLCISSSTQCFFFKDISLVLQNFVNTFCSITLASSSWDCSRTPQSLFIIEDNGRVFLASSVMLFLSFAFLFQCVRRTWTHTGFTSEQCFWDKNVYTLSLKYFNLILFKMELSKCILWKL